MTKENNGWISVKDDLPHTYPNDYYREVSKDILLYGIEDPRDSPCVFIGFMAYDGNFYSNQYGLCLKEGITHWQPLPEPPKS